MDDDLTSAARQLIVEAEFEPAATLTKATALLDGHEVHGYQLASPDRHLVLRAAGIAARQMGHFDEAETMLDACLREQNQDGSDRGHALTTRAGLFAMTGDFDRAFADLDSATACFEGPDRVHSAAQRAVVLHQSGALLEAAGAYEEALGLAQQANETVIEARLRSNLGVLWTHQADYDRASRELAESAALYRSIGHGNRLLFVEHNLGYVAMCQGRIIDALRHFENQRAAALQAGTSRFAISADLCHALMIAGLTDEAEAEAAAAAQHFEDQGALVAATDALTSAGRAALDSGDPQRAVVHLEHALALFDRAERTPWRAVAQVLLAKAQLAADGPVDQVALDTAIDVLHHAEMSDEATIARLISLQVAVRLGDRTVAGQRLAELGRAGRLKPHLRALYWLAAGHYRILEGRAAAASRAFDAGVRANRDFRRDLNGVDMVLSIGAVGGELAEAGLAMALTSARVDPIRVMRWIEAFESGAADQTGFSSVQVGTDIGSDRRSAALALTEALRDAESPEAVTAAAQRLHETERAERMQHRLAGHTTELDLKPLAATHATLPTRSDVQRELGDTDLIMIGDTGDRFVSVVRRGGKISCHRMGSKHATDTALAKLRARLRRAWGDLANTERNLPGLTAAAAEIETLLLPVESQRGAGPVVVILPTSLRALPLGLLPSLSRRPFVTAPSLQVYLAACRAAEDPLPTGHGALFVAGPDLAAATHEVQRSVQFHANAAVLDTDQASATAVLNALPAALVHFACHGVVRDDNPIFSSLQLSDGPLALHRFAGLDQVARTVILSGCDVGRPARRGRSHAVSLPRVLLDLGVASVIASSIAIPDGATADMMIGLHELLAHGAAPAGALAELRSADVPATRLIASVFSCHGTG